MSVPDDLLTNEIPEWPMTEYADQLRDWLNQAYQWQCMPYVMSCALLNNQYSNSVSGAPFINPIPNINVNANQTPQPANMQNETPAENNSERQPDLQQNGRVYEIPKLSKRLFAEVIDFGLLFLIKALVTLTVLDSWNLEELSLFENEEIQEGDYELAMAITANLLTIEFAHRLLVICYEVWFTHQGGATPGKRTMGITILSCNKCIQIGENRIVVQPGTQINFWKSLSRAFLKNMGAALLFPTFLPLMIVQHNRTLYDILCGTVVVQSD